MSKSFRYVKDFEFPSSAGFSGSAKGYCGGGKVMKKAEGGTVSKPVKPVKPEPVVGAGQREGYKRAHPPGSDAARMIARNERVMENRPHKAERLGAINVALKKNPNMTREQVGDLNKSLKPAATTRVDNRKTPPGKIVKKADGGGVTVNEAGERLFVSRPAASTTTTAATTATKTLSKRDQRRLDHQKRKAAQEAQREARRASNPGQIAKTATTSTSTGTTGTTTTAAKSRGGVMKKADGGSVRPPLRAASQPLTTRQNPAGSTRQYTPAENQQRAVARRAAMDKQDAARKAAHDARVSAAAKRQAAHDAENDARKGMNKPETEANKLKLAGKLTDKRGVGAAITNTGTTASAAMAKAHGGVAHKAMTKKSRGGVPAHSNTPMIKKAAGGTVAAIPSREGGVSYVYSPTGMKLSSRDYANMSTDQKGALGPVVSKKSRG